MDNIYRVEQVFKEMRFFGRFDHFALDLTPQERDEVRGLLAEAAKRDDQLVLDHIQKGGRWVIVARTRLEFIQRAERLGYTKTDLSPYNRHAKLVYGGPAYERLMGMDLHGVKALVMPTGRRNWQTIQMLEAKAVNIEWELWS
jgi:hypothetical protein